MVYFEFIFISTIKINIKKHLLTSKKEINLGFVGRVIYSQTSIVKKYKYLKKIIFSHLFNLFNLFS